MVENFSDQIIGAHSTGRLRKAARRVLGNAVPEIEFTEYYHRPPISKQHLNSYQRTWRLDVEYDASTDFGWACEVEYFQISYSGGTPRHEWEETGQYQFRHIDLLRTVTDADARLETPVYRVRIARDEYGNNLPVMQEHTDRHGWLGRPIMQPIDPGTAAHHEIDSVLSRAKNIF